MQMVNAEQVGVGSAGVVGSSSASFLLCINCAQSTEKREAMGLERGVE